ncbi:hypothetical protein AAG742_03325 [Micrococcus sp. 2A]|uniref:hypothetical protein n=1 Tax=Micrococcus sp. 2A TaxID=3142261 RepID=UPI0031BB2EFD
MKLTVHGNRLASLGARISLELTEGVDPELHVHAPFYSRTIPVHQIATITCAPDDGTNRGPLNWFVTGRATSPAGLRINNGGQARIDMSTTEGLRFVVVVDDLSQAEQLICAVQTSCSR